MTTLSSDTWKCHDAVQRELHSDSPMHYGLPTHWTLESVPEWEELEKTLLHYYPTVCEKKDIVRQSKLLLEYCYNSKGHEKKEFIARTMFRLLAVNHWFLHLHPKLALAIKNKLLEFKDGNVREHDLYKDFAWILDGTIGEIQDEKPAASKVSQLSVASQKHSYNLRSTVKK